MAEVPGRGQEGRGGDLHALALDRFEEQCRDVAFLQLAFQGFEIAQRDCGIGEQRAKALAEFDSTVDGKGADGEAVVGMVEDDNAGAACVSPGDLDRVLNRLRTRVEQGRPLLVCTGGEPGQLLGDSDVTLVRRDHEAGVSEVPRLGTDGLDDPRCAAAHGRDRDPGPEVNQAVTVDVLDDSARRPGGEDRHRSRHADADRGVLTGHQLKRPGAGNGCREVARLRELSGVRHAPQSAPIRKLLSKTCFALASCPVSIDLRLIRYFVATADAGSATQAAAQLHVSQPVLSRQLRQLEQQLGLRLFEREGRRLHLSRAAEDFLPEARALLRRAEDAERAAESLAGGRLSALHLAVPSTTLTDVLAPFIATFGKDDPVPIVRELDPRGAVAAVRAGADLAVVTRPPARALASRPLAVLPVWAYVRHDDPWARHASVRITDLATRPLTLLTPDFRPRALLDAAMDAAGIGYGDIIEVANAQVAQAIAASGRGTAVVSDDPRFALVPLRIDTETGPIRIHLYAAWEPRHHAARTLALLADRLAAFCVQRYGPEVAAAPLTAGQAPGTPRVR